MIFNALKRPDLDLDADDNKRLAKAVALVASHYEFLGGASPEAQAWASLIFTAGTIYGTRIATVAFEPKKPVARKAEIIIP